MNVAKHRSFLLASYVLFLAALTLAYQLTVLGAVVAVIGFAVGYFEVLERIGVAATRRLGKLAVIVTGAGLGAYLASRGDLLALGVLSLLGGLYLLPCREVRRPRA